MITYKNKGHLGSGTTNPRTLSFDCSGGNLLVLGIQIRSATARSGTPTYAGTNMVQAGSRIAGTGVQVETWYLFDPASGSNTISVANAGGLTIALTAVSFAGVLSYDTVNQSTGSTLNPSISLTPAESREVVVSFMTNELNTAATAVSDSELYRTDEGIWNTASQYTIKTDSAAETHTYTIAADNWAVQIVAFKKSLITLAGTSTAASDVPVSHLHKTGKFVVTAIQVLSNVPVVMAKLIRKLFGITQTTSSAIGDLKVFSIVTFVGVSTGQSDVPVSHLHLSKRLLGLSTGQSDVPLSHLHLSREFIGSSTGQSDVPLSHLHLTKRLLGSSTGQSNVPNALFHKSRVFAGVTGGTSSASGSLRQTREFVGVSGGQSGCDGILFVGKPNVVTLAGVSASTSKTGQWRL